MLTQTHYLLIASAWISWESLDTFGLGFWARFIARESRLALHCTAPNTTLRVEMWCALDCLVVHAWTTAMDTTTGTR